MTPQQLQIAMIWFEARAGSSEGYPTFDSGGVMHNTGGRTDQLDSNGSELNAASEGYVLYDNGDVSFHER